MGGKTDEEKTKKKMWQKEPQTEGGNRKKFAQNRVVLLSIRDKSCRAQNHSEKLSTFLVGTAKTWPVTFRVVKKII